MIQNAEIWSWVVRINPTNSWQQCTDLDRWGINCFKVFTGSVNIYLKICWLGKKKFCCVPSTGNTETGVAISVWSHATDFHWKWLVVWRSRMNIELFASLFLWASACCAERLSPSSSSSYTNTADLHMIPYSLQHIFELQSPIAHI